jgi:hypothetical protein
MDCTKCSHFTNEYEHLERIYGLAIEALTNHRAISTASEYRVLRAACDEARTDAQVALLKLLKHQESHRKANLEAGTRADHG